MRLDYRIPLAAAALALAAFSANAQQDPGAPVVRPWQSLHPGLNRPVIAPKAPTPSHRVRPVPEPSQWALMATGLGLVAWIVRRRSKRNKD